VYVVDNASTDKSVEYITKSFPSVKIKKNKSNYGYAKGYNDALRDIDSDIYCLLNNDVEVSENWLEPIVLAFKRDPSIAIIQPKILDYNRKNYFEYAGAAGGFIDKYGYPYCRGRIFNTLEKDYHQYDGISDIFWASGACFFIIQSVFKNLEGFDEHYFAHQEEIDLCWRTKNLGYKIKFVSNSSVYHLGGGTLNANDAKKIYLNFRNSLFNITKNANGHLFTLIFVRLCLDGIAAIIFLFHFKLNHMFAIIKAHTSFYRRLPKLLKQRKKLNQETNYYRKSSIVWEYFIKQKKTYNRL